MNAALPFFVLSAVALILWVEPGGRALMTVEEMGKVMEIEGFALFGAALLTVGVSSLKSASRKNASSETLWMLPFALVATLLLGGFPALIGGSKYFFIYILLQLTHLIAVFRTTYDDLKIEYGVNMVTLFSFAILGLLAVKAPFLPAFDNKYPAVFSAWNFRIGGHQMLAWAFVHFALLGFVHLKKRTMFARMLQQDL